MKEVNKYYTPEIEEFYVGFEYEIYKHNQWVGDKLSSGRHLDTEVDLGYKDIKPNVRVKHLSRQCIEELGFTQIEL